MSTEACSDDQAENIAFLNNLAEQMSDFVESKATENGYACFHSAHSTTNQRKTCLLILKRISSPGRRTGS